MASKRRFGAAVRLASKILLVLVLTFLALEFLLLAFNDLIFHDAFYVFDPDMGFRVRPYARYGNQQANEFGFNDRDYPHDRRPNTFRILILGDSFNWMGGQENNYTALLERRFEQEFGEGRVEIISAGYPQTHTAEQLALLEKYGLQYNPDLVVVGFYAGNDFFDAHPGRKRIVVGSVPVDVYEGRDFYATLLGQPLVFRSRLFLFLREKWTVFKHFSSARREATAQRRETHSSQQRLLPAPQGTAPQPLRGSSGESGPPGSPVQSRQKTVSLPTADYLRMLSARMTFTRVDRPPIFEQFERYVFDSLIEMRSLLKARGIGFLVAVYPDEIQVDPTLREALVEYDRRTSSDYQWDRAQFLLQQWCARNAVEFYDLLSHFREAHRQGRRLYKRNDSHWNTTGNRLAAQLLFGVLAPRARQALEQGHH
ncbi:MAG: hypothetical protein ACE5JX_19775 [Acidobacteriota bacterium]